MPADPMNPNEDTETSVEHLRREVLERLTRVQHHGRHRHDDLRDLREHWRKVIAADEKLPRDARILDPASIEQITKNIEAAITNVAAVRRDVAVLDEMGNHP